MRDVQHRLSALGFGCGGDEPGTYGDATEAAVRLFQERRGLHADGVCGDHTWSALVEAGYRLGDRLLFLAAPLLRGDDVAELQRRLGSLGFDAGKIDGIFGERTNRALLDFQRNVGLVTDATCGPATLAALARLGSAATTSPPSVAAVWERERHRRRPPTLAGRTVAVGDTGGLDAVARAVAAAVLAGGGRSVLLQHPDPRAQAAEANALEVDCYVGLTLRDPGATGGGVSDCTPVGCWTAYYRSPDGSESPEGRRLASLVQEAVVPVLGATDGGVRGMAVPVLRETRMPAIVTELGAATVVVERSADLAAALTAALRRWVAPSVEA